MLLESGNVSNNEIIKAIDLNNSFVAQIENIGKVFKTTFGIDKDFVIGKQKLIEFSSMAESDWGLIINPVFGLCNKTNTMFLNTENTTASIQAPIDGESRVDTIEVQGKLEGDGLDKRAFIDFNTMSKTVMPVDTKLVLKLKFNVVKGIPGSIAAPQHTDGWVKIGEIVVPGNATKISDCTIRNITSDVIGEINADWTNEKDCTYNLSSVTEINKHFRKAHEISGEHKENSINIKHIKTGIESDDVNSTVIPSGKQFTINEEVVGNTESLASVIEKIVSVLNNTVTGKQNLITITDDSNAITDETAFIEMDADQNPSSGKRHLFSKIWTWIVSHTKSVLTTNDTNPVNSVAVLEGLSKKQDNLVSGSNIKTIHSKSLVGEGDVTLSYSDVGALAENGKAVSAGSADSAAEANHALSADIASAVARAKFGDNTNETHDCNEALNNGFYYYTANGPSTDIGASTTDGGLYVQRYSDDWLCQIAQDYRNGTLFVRGKNNGSWTAWQKIGAADNAKKLETWKADGSGTYGAQYMLYAKWADSILLKLVCDGYTVKVDAADSAGNAGHATTADSATNATSAGISTSVVDYGDGSTPIKIGYAGTGLETATYLAGYYVDEAGNRFIKDISPSKVTVGGAGNSDTLDGRHEWGFNMVRQSSNVGSYSTSLDALADGYFSCGMTNGGGPFGGLWTHFINLGWNVGGSDWNSQIAICPQDTTKPMMFRPYGATADWHTLIDDKNINNFLGPQLLFFENIASLPTSTTSTPYLITSNTTALAAAEGVYMTPSIDDSGNITWTKKQIQVTPYITEQFQSPNALSSFMATADPFRNYTIGIAYVQNDQIQQYSTILEQYDSIKKIVFTENTPLNDTSNGEGMLLPKGHKFSVSVKDDEPLLLNTMYYYYGNMSNVSIDGELKLSCSEENIYSSNYIYLSGQINYMPYLTKLTITHKSNNNGNLHCFTTSARNDHILISHCPLLEEIVLDKIDSFVAYDSSYDEFRVENCPNLKRIKLTTGTIRKVYNYWSLGKAGVILEDKDGNTIVSNS